MRNDQEFLAEIYSREAKYIKRKKQIVKATLLSVIPLFVCTAVVLSLIFGPGFVSFKNSAPTADRETHLYTGDYEEITDTADDAEGEVAEDTAAESETDNGTVGNATQQTQQYVGETLDGALEKPTESSNSDDKSQDNLSVNSAAGTPLQGQITGDSVTSEASGSATKSETATSEATKQDSVANNNGQLATPQWVKYLQKKWKPVVDAESFTLIYDSEASHVSDETAVNKMELFITEAGDNIVDYGSESKEVLTIEMGGMKFKLKSTILYNETLDENYLLEPKLVMVLRYNLAENNLLSENLEESFENIINSFDKY